MVASRPKRQYYTYPSFTTQLLSPSAKQLGIDVPPPRNAPPPPLLWLLPLEEFERLHPYVPEPPFFILPAHLKSDGWGLERMDLRKYREGDGLARRAAKGIAKKVKLLTRSSRQ